MQNDYNQANNPCLSLCYYYEIIPFAMKKYLLFALLFICCMFSLKAQLRMEFNTTLNNTPFRVAYGDSVTYRVFIINQDSITLAGDLYAGFTGINSGTPGNAFLGSFQIAPGDTAHTSISIEVTPAYFKVGPEVVVVWPIFDGFNGTQLADFILVRDNTSAINDFDSEIQKIVIRNGNVYIDDLQLKQVRIFDLSGRIVSDFAPEQSSFPLPPLARSIYVLQCITTDNKNIVVKFIEKR